MSAPRFEKVDECPEWIIEHPGIQLEKPASVGIGSRHEKLKQVARAMRGEGHSEEYIIGKLAEINLQFKDGPKPVEEVLNIVKWNMEKVVPDEKENWDGWDGWDGFTKREPNITDDKDDGGQRSNASSSGHGPKENGNESKDGGGIGESRQNQTNKETVEEIATEKKLDFPVEALGSIMAAPTKILAERIGVPIEIVCSSMLAAAALCVQEYYDLDFFGGVRPLSLFFLTIAESGERKSTVDKLVLREHYDWRSKKQKIYVEALIKYKEAMEKYKAAQAKKEVGLSKPLAPKAPVLFASEPTVEGLFFCLKFHRNSIGIFSDEGGGFLGGHSMRQDSAKSSLAKLNQLWDGSAIDRIRKGNTEEGEVDILEGKRVSMHLMIQPSVATEIFNNEHAKSMGFLARCLTCQPQSRIGTRDFNMSITAPGEMHGFYDRARLFLNRVPGERKQVLKITKGAEALIKDYYHDIEGKQADGGEFSNIKAFASKAIEHCIRIAAVIETFTNQDDALIDENAISRAIAIIPFYLGAQKKVTDKSTVYPSKDCEVIHQKIATRKDWLIRDLLQMLPRKYRKKELLMPHVKQLIDAGWCRINQETGKISI